ncbi:transposase [Bradyrhizobium sp. RT9b]
MRNLRSAGQAWQPGDDGVVLSHDSTSIKAHRCASGGKGGAPSSNWPLARRPHDKNPCTERSALPADRPASDARPGFRYRGGARCPGARATHERAPRQQRRRQARNPNKSNRVVIHRFNKRACKGRNVIEHCFCRLKDFRRVATRYDKLARSFLAAAHLAALVAYWLSTRDAISSAFTCLRRTEPLSSASMGKASASLHLLSGEFNEPAFDLIDP